MKIRFVNGYKIRQFLDVDFNSFHFQQKNPLNLDSKWYIPKGEVWCDITLKDEISFLKKVELSSVDSRNEAIKKFKTKGKIPDFIVRKKKQRGVMVVYVNGALVRQHIDPWFVCGGHGYVYAYVPKNEIWIDAKMDSRDVPHVLLHESIEREFMKNNKKSYDTAHEYASVAEKESRQKAGGSYIGYVDYPYEDFKKLIQSFYV